MTASGNQQSKDSGSLTAGEEGKLAEVLLVSIM